MTVLTNARLIDGAKVDVVIGGGVITAVTAVGGGGDGETIDLQGRLLLPALGEPHAHLDKAFTAEVVPNPTGDLGGAVEAIRAAWPLISVEDIIERAERSVRALVASGTTLIRSHVDVAEGEQKSALALAEVRRRTAHLCDLELVALVVPLSGPDADLGIRAMERAIESGVDVVGGCPHLDEDPEASIDVSLRMAHETGRSVDLHFDEVLDVTVQHLPYLAGQVERLGLGGRVTASHCVSHGLLPVEEQRRIGSMLASAGVSVVTNPRTNLFLQSRRIDQAPPRGLAGVRALLDSGTLVAGGADNVQDPFYTIGRNDPLETASFLVSVAHLTIEEALTLVTDSVRSMMGRPRVSVKPGDPAELVAVAAVSVREAIAEQPIDRMVFHRGNLVASTTSTTWLAPG